MNLFDDCDRTRFLLYRKSAGDFEFKRPSPLVRQNSKFKTIVSIFDLAFIRNFRIVPLRFKTFFELGENGRRILILSGILFFLSFCVFLFVSNRVFAFVADRALFLSILFLDFFTKNGTRLITIETLGSVERTFDFNSGRFMLEMNRGGNLRNNFV